MQYMERNVDKRTDPAALVEGTRSVISVILNYYPARRQEHADAPVLSVYAYGKDYHEVIRKKLNKLLQFMNETMGPVNGRGFTDSAPVLDRAWAARAGLGWIGRNSLLITPRAGSYFFIGTLLVDIELEEDRPIRDFCGDCNRIRVTAEGKLRTCLFSMTETDLRTPMRSGATDDELETLIRTAVWEKELKHHVNDPGFWLFKEYFNLSIPETFKTWSALETIIAVGGLAGVLILDALLATGTAG